MGDRVVGVELDRAPKLALGVAPLEVGEEIHGTHRRVRVGERGIQDQGLLRLLAHPGPALAPGDDVQHLGEERVGVRDAAVRPRIVGIQRHRLFVELDRQVELFQGGAVLVEAALEV